MTELRHSWEPDPSTKLQDVCSFCGVKRRQRKMKVPGGPAAGVWMAEYLVSGIGWTLTRPECFDAGIVQKRLFHGEESRGDERG